MNQYHLKWQAQLVCHQASSQSAIRVHLLFRSAQQGHFYLQPVSLVLYRIPPVCRGTWHICKLLPENCKRKDNLAPGGNRSLVVVVVSLHQCLSTAFTSLSN